MLCADRINAWTCLRENRNSIFGRIILDCAAGPESPQGVAEAYLGHPHQNGKVWSALKTVDEDLEMLRLQTFDTLEQFDPDFMDVTGDYVIRDKIHEELHFLHIEKPPGAKVEKIVAPVHPAKRTALRKELVQGTYVLDEMHRYDSRWKFWVRSPLRWSRF